MTLPEQAAPLLAPLAALQRLIDRLDGRGVIIGGMAAGLLGQPRFTADLDAMVLASNHDIPRILEFAHAEGIERRRDDIIEFARINRVLLMKHAASGIGIDISLGVLPFEQEVVERSLLHAAGGLAIRLPSPEDLIILKAVAHRPKDLLDIQSIVASNSNLDRMRIKKWVTYFAEALEMADLLTEIESLLQS